MKEWSSLVEGAHPDGRGYNQDGPLDDGLVGDHDTPCAHQARRVRRAIDDFLLSDTSYIDSIDSLEEFQ